ncbi:MAG: hypothetical protein U9R79_09185, partial [Armatimonadota bacterium]|nr:hypothetical protein [Armatimonadota bacterium]
LRQDGIASLHAAMPGGEMTTRPFTIQGSELVIKNATSAAGSIQVELQDAEGRPLPGRELESCPPIYGDELARVVAWESGSDVGQWAGEPVRMRVRMSDADLYSFQFRDG